MNDKIEQKTYAYVYYKQAYESGGEVCEGQEDDDWPSYEDTYYDFYVTHVTPSLKKGVSYDAYYESIKVDHSLFMDRPKHVWVVVVRYYDGDTFGCSRGHGSIQGAFLTRSEADERAVELKSKTIHSKSKDSWYPWTGYFAGLESIDIVHVPVEYEV